MRSCKEGASEVYLILTCVLAYFCSLDCSEILKAFDSDDEDDFIIDSLVFQKNK